MSFFFPVEDVQVSCYRILTSLYALGTGKNIYVERCATLSNFMKSQRDVRERISSRPMTSGSLRQLPALGQCLATLAGAMPVAFLEPLLNTYNPCSVFNTKSARERASESYIMKAECITDCAKLILMVRPLVCFREKDCLTKCCKKKHIF